MSKKHVKAVSGSKKIVATLPYLRPLFNEVIDQLEISFSLRHLYTATENFFFDSLQKQFILGEWLDEIHDEKYPYYPHHLGFSNAYDSYWNIPWNDFFYCQDLDGQIRRKEEELEEFMLEHQ